MNYFCDGCMVQKVISGTARASSQIYGVGKVPFKYNIFCKICGRMGTCSPNSDMEKFVKPELKIDIKIDSRLLFSERLRIVQL